MLNVQIANKQDSLHIETSQWVWGLRWLLVSTVAGVVASVVTMDLTLTKIGNLFLNLNLRGAAIGAIFGILQWLVLRKLIYGASWWILASTLGWILGEAIAQLWTIAVTGIMGVEVRAIVVGAAVGLVQWFVLRRFVYGAGWWILASTIGWTVAETIALLLMIGWATIIGGFAIDIIVGAVVGAVTGFALVLLLINPRPGVILK